LIEGGLQQHLNMATQEITNINNIVTTENDWWMVYENGSKIVIEGIYQCAGTTSGPNTTIMVVADTKEELLTYITDNGLTISEDIENRGY
tara:strand:- start:252 stop:521 length:270 start_codon:yes stop_codon:yes gene_type:complete